MVVKSYTGNDKLFLTAWKLATVKYDGNGQEIVPTPTKRQYTKWKQLRGLAYSKFHEACHLLHGN